MCGFAGAVVWDERYRVSPETLRRMTAAVAHRGPDGEARRLTREHDPITPDHPQVALGFRRLAILDPDERSMQPFTDGRRWLVFNGEIYNFRDLRAELSDRNTWRTTGDTEVLLAAYAAWGERCVDRLNGMFAFAVWDEVDKTLFLARDRMGQKPLYVAYLDTTGRSAGVPFNDSVFADRPDWAVWSAPLSAVAFASDPRCLTPLDWIDRRVAPVPLMDYLRWGCVPSARTSIFAGLGQVPMGWSARVAHGRTRQVEYFDPAGGRSTVTDEPAVDRSDPVRGTRQRVVTAVVRQLVSDVPVGCLLSGGIDSSVIASVMRSEAGVVVDTFSVGFDDPRYDESAYAARVAAHLGTRHHPLTVRPDDLLDLTAVAATFGEPFGDSSAVPTLALAKHARSAVKVALGGDGGDELFGGYDRYRAMRLAGRIRSVTTPLPWLIPARLLRRVGDGPAKSLPARIVRFARSLALPPGRRYSGYRRLFSDRQLADLIADPENAAMAVSQFDNIAGDFSGNRHGVVRTAMASDRVRYLPDDLLTKVDRCSMFHGLEVRSPFLDHDLVTFAAGLTTDQLLKGGPKRMLREAFAADLPAWVFRRRKMGFAVPIGDWFRGPLRAMLRDTLFAADAFGRSRFDMAVVRRLVDEHESGRVDHAQRLYALLMLELWWHTAGR